VAVAHVGPGDITGPGWQSRCTTHEWPAALITLAWTHSV
jgi:hypothetical protein